ncbi:Rha family transcriptional regulator [Escherichia coli]|uniref:Rha family transcriptional regulator n=1 Tax=Escherichia coli TaxID=562 RepID=UPI002DE7C35C|nr:Rha family transcriptional regulator [Escherichia coli]MEC4950336.1 Rha family transcriptional regulator [Escherichia coli]MEC4965890.1 Rha family transcriptional regulator [Escherichia coli]MEC5006646.1 Rha family transcriptional regulator [Escherichia coli]MEC5017029.1 Rha family transcriptional regulator [Escherichia coli]
MNYPDIVNGIDFRDLVMVAGDSVLTTSVKVAEFFGKSHKNVLRKIRQIISECPDDFARLNFEPTDFIDKNGDIQPMFNMTKDGYMLVVMGFTGKAAMKMKVAYIQAFNWMAELIRQGVANLEAARNAVMLEYMKEKDVASMSGRLLNRWGRVKKPQLQARIEQLEQRGQISLPGIDSVLTH